MPEPFHKKVVEYRLPDGSYRTPDGRRVTKKTRGAVRSESASPYYYGTVNGRQVRLARSLEVSRRMLGKLLGDASLGTVGIDTKAEDQARRPLLEHLEDYSRALAARDNCAEHVAKTVAQCKAVIEGCEFQTAADLAEGPVEEFLASLRKRDNLPRFDPTQEWYTVAEVAKLCGITMESVRRLTVRGQFPGEGVGRQRRHAAGAVRGLLERRARGIGPEQSNHYLRSIKSFTRWLVRNKRLAADPLAGLSALNPDVDLRHERRALAAQEFLALVEATRPGKAFRGLAGADRVVLYCLAGNTGLRAGELASLSPGSFDLDADPPTVTVAAGYSKHRRKDTLPLREDLVALLRDYLEGKDRDAPLWPGTWEGCAAEMLRIDLAAAGIPYRDGQGRVADFHALRHGFISCLALGGVHPKVAQQLARHSTITLTLDRYTHLGIVDAAEGLKALPPLPGARTNAREAPERREA
jgi:integrase